MRRSLLEPADPVEEFFHAADGESGDDHLPAARRGFTDHHRELVTLIIGRMIAVSIGGFDEHRVGLHRVFRIGQHGPPVAAEIAAEQDRRARRSTA